MGLFSKRRTRHPLEAGELVLARGNKRARPDTVFVVLRYRPSDDTAIIAPLGGGEPVLPNVRAASLTRLRFTIDRSQLWQTQTYQQIAENTIPPITRWTYTHGMDPDRRRKS